MNRAVKGIQKTIAVLRPSRFLASSSSPVRLDEGRQVSSVGMQEKYEERSNFCRREVTFNFFTTEDGEYLQQTWWQLDTESEARVSHLLTELALLQPKSLL